MISVICKSKTKNSIFINIFLGNKNDGKNYEEILNILSNKRRNFAEEVSVFLYNIMPKKDLESKKFEVVCVDLKNILDISFSDCTVCPFGSTITGLNFYNSDIDVYVEVTQAHKGLLSGKLLNMAKSALESPHNNKFTTIKVIPKARVPIIKCTHIATNINCDVNFKSKLPIYNSQFIKYFMALNENFFPTLLILKYWAKVKNLIRESSGFTSYSLAIMFVFFAQCMDKAYPSLYGLQLNKEYDKFEDGWNCGFERKPLPVFNSRISVTELLMKFFIFYRDFKYDVHIICPFLGKTVNKPDIIDMNKLGKEFFLYGDNYLKNNELLNTEHCICVQDPFEHARNITLGVNHKLLEQFIADCSASFLICSNVSPSLCRLFTGASVVPKAVSTNTCQCKIGIGNCMDYIQLQIKKENLVHDDATVQKIWFQMFKKYITKLLEDILKLNILNIQEMPYVKFYKSNQDSTSKTNNDDFNMLNIHCTGKRDVVYGRKKISLELKIPDNITGILEKEEYISNYVKTPPKIQYDINLYVMPLKDPTEIKVQLEKNSNFKGCFDAFSHFFIRNVPYWFSTYQTELNEVAKKTMLQQ